MRTEGRREGGILYTEPEFLNFYGAQELSPRNQFRQPMYPGGPVRQLYS